jgi:hypothetical protein
MSAITTTARFAPSRPDLSTLRPLRRARRSRGIRGLVAGHRVMAWRSLRRGDVVTAEMHSACAAALRRECPRR